MSGRTVDWKSRLNEAWRIADANGTIGDVAKAWGCTRANVTKRLKDRDTHLHRMLLENMRRPHVLSTDATVLRLRNVAELGIRGAARQEGVDPAAIFNWMKRNAPDGPIQALNDYMDDELETAA